MEVLGSNHIPITDYDSQLCRLCFLSENTLPRDELTELNAFKDKLEILCNFQIPNDYLNTWKICLSCVGKIGVAIQLRERVKFSIPFWGHFTESTTVVQPVNAELVLNCHSCGDSYSHAALLDHIVHHHGLVHIDECLLCSALLQTKDESQLGDSAIQVEVLENDNDEEEELTIYDITDEAEDGNIVVKQEDCNDTGKRNRVACDLCNKSYCNTERLRTHKQRVHQIALIDLERPFDCNYCAMSYKHENGLQKHLLSHPEATTTEDAILVNEKQKALFPCSICDRSFTRVHLRDNHMTQKHTQCSQCDPPITFSSADELQNHEDLLHSFICHQCNKALRTEALLQTHLKSHETEIHHCENCPKTFPQKKLLVEHQLKMHLKKHRCPVCHNIYPRVEALNEHVAQDHEKLTCFTCEVEFATLRGLKLHETMHNSALSDADPSDLEEVVATKLGQGIKRAFPCKQCDESFKSQKSLDHHLIDRHDEKGYQCDQCERKYESKQKLRQHSYKHRLKLCGICGQRISNSMNIHMRRHANDKPFKCKVEGCGKQFPRNSDLMVHTKTHTGERPFGCEVCGMRFTRKNKVTVHMRTHTGEKPYKCHFPGCERQFAQSFDLTLHKRRHTGEKPYQCNRCGLTFIMTSVLKAHQVNCKEKVELISLLDLKDEELL